MKHVLAILLLLFPVLAWGQGAGSVAVVPTVADLTNRVPSQLNPVVSLLGYRTNGDFGAPRTIRYIPDSTNAVDNGCTFATVMGVGRWEAPDCEGTFVDPRWFGAADDEIDDTAAITAAAAKIQSKGGGTLLVPRGTYSVSKIGPVAHFTNISNVSISAENAVFTEADYVDSTWTSVTLTNLGIVATAVWASPHGFSPGSLFLVKDSTDVAFDGYWTVTHVDSPTKIRFNLTAYNVPAGAATALAHVSDTSHVLFRFDSCTNVNLGKIVFRGHVLPVDNQFRLGWRVVETFRGTKGVRGELDVEGVAYGLYSGEYGNQSISGCSDLRVKVVAKNVGYPVQATGTDDSAFEVVCDTVHRAGYFGGVRRSSANIWAKNWDIVGALLSHQPDPVDSRGCEDFTLRVWDTGTTVPQKLLAYGGYRHMASVAGYANTNAVKHRNLDIRVYGKNVPRGAGLIVQTYGTNHWVDGLKFGGNIDQSGLNSTNTGWPFYIYDTSTTTAGHYKDLVIEDFTWKSTTNSGAYPGYIRLAQAENDVEFNRYSTDIYTSQGLPDGIHTVTVPRFPDWTAGSFEAAQIQGIGGGISFIDTTTVLPMASGVSSNDFTVQWVGDVPSDNSGLFVLTSGASATTGSFGASVTNGHLIVRAYGASSGDWIGLTATNWASARRGKVASLGIVKTASGLSIYTDGHTTYGTNTSSGTPPAWSDAVIGTNVLVGVDNPGSGYLGKVYRLAVWNFSRAMDFPELAVRWESGAMPAGGSGYTISDSIGNGSFETLGGGGADVFAAWTEQADGGSTITASTNAIDGSVSMALSVDGLASFVGVSSSEVLVPGAVYEVSFWGRVVDGTSGQIALVGAAGGDYPISLSGSWARYSYSLAWNAVSFSIKRWSLTGLTAEIDDVRVRRVGVLCDYDWTKSPADMVSGTYSSPLGGVSTKVLARGLGISADRGDNSANLEAGQDAPIQVWASDITGARSVNLQTNHARRGDLFRIVRTGAGAGTLTAAGVSVTPGTWADFAYDGANWSVMASGSGVSTSGGVLSRTPDWVNVLDYGAVGDATTDDTAAIQAAVNAVKASSGTVYFPPGRYRLSQSLDGTTAATGFVIQGAGNENTVILGSDPGYPLLDFTGANKVILRDFTVWGNVPGTNVSLCGILWGRPASNASSGEHLMERVRVWGNFKKWGVLANSAELCVYRECEFYAGYNLAPPDNAMTAFCLSGGSGTRGLTSRYNTPGNGSGGNSSQGFYDCKFYNYVPTTVTGYFTTYNLELDGVMTCTMVNPYYYSRYNGTQVKLNNLSTTAFDTLDIIGARHEYLTPLSGGTEPASYSAAAAEKFKSIRIQGGTLTYFFGEGGSWITGLKINDVMWKTIAFVPVVDVWILIDSDLTANKGGEGSFAQIQTPTYSIRGWSHNVNLDYQRTQNYGMHSTPDLGFGRRGLVWDGATTNSALLHSIPTNRIGTNDFTIYLRVKLPPSMPGNHAGIATLTPAANGIAAASSWTARLNVDGRIETFLFDATGAQYQSKYVPSDFWTQNKGEIADLVFVRTTNDCKVYINGWYDKGDEDQSTALPPGWGADVSASTFAIGLSASSSQYWRSEIYRAALFNRALTDTEILALTHSTFQIDTDAIIPDLAQGFGTTIEDLGTGGYDGNLVGGVSHLLLSGAARDSDLLDGQHGAFYLNRTNHTGTQPHTTITGLGPLAIGDAPTNGLLHGRLDGAWTAIASNHVAGLSNWMSLKSDVGHTQSYTTITGLGSLATVNDAASDGTTYGRQNGAWAPVSSGLSDAPSNGSPHGREDGAWVIVAEAAHTHDASNTVSGQFESARLGSGTSDTDTFLRGGDTPTWDQLSADDIPNLPASRITSGTFDPARLGTGTATTNTFLQGDGSGGALWGTIPSVASPTNGIADAPADGIFYGRLNNAWTQPDISHLSGVSGFGLAWVDGTVADSTDALDALDLIGAGVATIDSPATYAVRVGSGGTISTRHRLNLIASGGLSLSISDDAGNDESDVTVSVADAGITYAKIEDVTASRILGRGEGGGDGVVQELTLGGGLTMTGTTIHTNPVVVAASKLVGRGSASGSGAAEEITLGTGLTMTGTTLDVSPGTIPQLLLVTTSETTDANQDTTWRDVTPTPRSGMTATIASGGLLTGHVLKVEVTGAMTTSTSGDFRPELRLLLDGATSDYAITWIMNEPYSSSPYAGATWTAEATIVIGASGSPATVRQRSRALYEAGETPGPGVSSYSSTGVATGSLYTGEDNVVKLEYRAMDADMTNFKVTSLIVTRY